MSNPKLHHYVPQFYLKRFCDPSGGLWVWDKQTRKTYRATTQGVAAQSQFYRIPEFIGTKVDPLVLEKALSALEGGAATVLTPLLTELEGAKHRDRISLSREDRETLAWFTAVQFLRSAEQREILALFAIQSGVYTELDEDERANLHAQMLYSGGLVEALTQHLTECIWLFARNESPVPLWTSDSPVAFKTGDSRRWLKGPGITGSGAYAVFPLSPQYILYCKEPSHWSGLKELDACLSPVGLTDGMVEHENAGQVFMATRHVISPEMHFAWADEFVETIGTDKYAQPGELDLPTSDDN